MTNRFDCVSFVLSFFINEMRDMFHFITLVYQESERGGGEKQIQRERMDEFK